MTKKSCPTLDLESYIQHGSEAFESSMKALTKDWSELEAGTALYRDILAEDTTGDKIAAQAFLEWAKGHEEYNWLPSGILRKIMGKDEESLRFMSEIPAPNEAVDVNRILSVFEDIELSSEEGGNEEGEANDGSSSIARRERRVAQTGLDHSNSVFFTAIRERATSEQIMLISEYGKTEGNTFDLTIEFAKDILDDENIADSPRKLDDWHYWYNTNLKINKKTRDEVAEFVLIDSYKKKVGNEEKIVITKNKFIPTAKPTDENGNVINPLTNRKEPSTLPVAFYEMEEYGDGILAGEATASISFKDGILNTRQNRTTKEYFNAPANAAITSSFLKYMDDLFISKLKMTVVAAASGSSSKMYLAKILPEHYKALSPVEDVEKVLPVIEKALGEKVVNFIKENDYKLGESIKLINKRGGKKNYKGHVNLLTNIQNKIAQKNFRKFFTDEHEVGNINEDNLQDYLKMIDNPKGRGLDHIDQLASEIAKYRWMQTQMTPEFLTLGNVMNLFDRTKLTAAKGTVEVGSGPTKGTLIDTGFEVSKNGKKLLSTNTTWYVDGNKVEHIKWIDSLGQFKYIGDGTLFTSSGTFDSRRESSGRVTHEPIRESKTVRVNKSSAGFSADKSMRTTVIPGLEIKDKEGNTVIKTKLSSDGTKVSITGPNGKPINDFLTRDERKLSTGEYDKYHTVTTSEENSERTIIQQGDSKNSAAFSLQWLELLVDHRPVHTKIRKIFEKHALNIATEWTDRVLRMAVNPDAMRAGVKRMLEYHGKDLMTEVQKHYEISEKALHHPSMLSMFIPMINNQFFRDGAFKARTIHKKYVGSTRTALKSDIGEYVSDYNNMVLSSNNAKMYSLIKNRYFKSLISEDPAGELKNRWDALDKSTKIDVLNEYLKRTEEWGLVHRPPTDSVTAVALKRIEKLTGEWDSDSNYLDSEFVYGPQRADHDGDHNHIEMLPDEVTKELLEQGLMGNQSPIDDLPINLDVFVDEYKNQRYSNRDSYFKVIAALVNSAGAQGLAYNMRTIRGNLAFKNFEMRTDKDEFVRVIQPTDIVNMDYISLKESTTKSKDFSTLNEAEIEVEGKKRYLKTTSEHELAFIANAATDNPKKLRLVQMGYRGISAKGVSPSDWWISKIFFIEDTKNGTIRRIDPNSKADRKKYLVPLRKVYRYFNHANSRQGKTYQGKVATMKETFEMSKEMLRRISMSSEDMAEELVDLTGIKTLEGAGVYGEISLKNNPTSVEKLLAVPYHRSRGLLEKRGISHPFGDYKVDKNNENKLWNVHWRTMKEIGQVDVTREELEAGNGWIKRNGEKFFEIFAERKSNLKDIKFDPTLKKIDHDENMIKWTKKSKAEIDGLSEQYGEGVKTVVTWRYLNGIGERKFLGFMPSVDILDADLIRQFKEIWEQNYLSEDVPWDRKETVKTAYANILRTSKPKDDC